MGFWLALMNPSTLPKVFLSPSVSKVDGNGPGEAQASPVILL
jgi:hypothetical protein